MNLYGAIAAGFGMFGFIMLIAVNRKFAVRAVGTAGLLAAVAVLCLNLSRMVP
jgi:hypothetical protein